MDFVDFDQLGYAKKNIMYNYVEKLQLYCLLTSLQLLKEHICSFLKKKKKENNNKKRGRFN